MIVGHAPLAFAIAATCAVVLGLDRRRALLVGVLAGCFAVVPDVDVVYAVLGGLGSLSAGLWTANEAFWESASVVHRGITHSLAIGLLAASAFGLSAGRDRMARLGGGTLLLGLLGLTVLTAGVLGVAMLVIYLIAGACVVALARRWTVGVRATLGAAVVGLGTHPFGDLFTGTPPALLYPLDVRLLGERVALVADPTMNLLAVFGLELLSIWLAIAVAATLLGVRIRDRVDRQAVLGAAYGLGALVLPAPTLDVSYHFVFSVVGVGVVGAPALRHRPPRPHLARGFLTGLGAVTLAVLAYALGYAIV